MCDDWVIHPAMLYPVRPDEFQVLESEEWGRVAYHAPCPCGGTRDARVVELKGAKRLELHCPVCGKFELAPSGQKKRTPPAEAGGFPYPSL